MNKQPTQAPSLLHGHPYRHSTEGVDVQATWRKHGWTPSVPKPIEPLKKYREQRQ